MTRKANDMTKKANDMAKIEADATVEDAKPARSKRRVVMIGVIGVVLIGASAGGVLYAHNAGIIHVGFLGEPVDPNRPQLVLRDSEDGTGFGSQSPEGSGEPRRNKANYYLIEKEFTSNLNDSESFVQVGLGVSSYYDERVFANLQRHEMAVRSSVLLTISSQDPVQLSSTTGKLELQEDLQKAINDVLRAKEGFGGIDSVYFTSFVMQ